MLKIFNTQHMSKIQFSEIYTSIDHFNWNEFLKIKKSRLSKNFCKADSWNPVFGLFRIFGLLVFDIYCSSQNAESLKIVKNWSCFFIQIECEAIKKQYGEQINGLEPLKITRPPKPVPAPEAPKEAAKEAPKEEKEVPAAPPPETSPMTEVSA